MEHSPPLNTYVEHKNALAGRVRGEEVTLRPRDLRPKRIEERLIQCVWSDQMLYDDGLTTTTGKSVSVVDPGRWNHEAGPDFLGASLVINGQSVKGDVEIHVDARDWRRHDHHRDFEYNRVVLHAVLDAGDDKKRDTKHNGQEVDRLVLRPFLRPDLETIQRSLNPEDYPVDQAQGRGKCAQIVDEMSDAFLERWFDLAAVERMEDKVRRFGEQASGEPLDQVFYQGLMTSMGHKGGKALFFLLAKRAPLVELADFMSECSPHERAIRVESILLHVASLAPDDDSDERLDDETRVYLARLREHWAAVGGYFTDRVIPPTKRWYSGVRPVNFAPRRLSGVANLIASAEEPGRFFAELADNFKRSAPRSPTRKTAREVVNGLNKVFNVESDGYWSRRYSFTAKKSARPMRLIGKSRAQSLVLNAFLPITILKAQRDGDDDLKGQALALYRKFPKLQENSVTKFMRQRLFSDDGRAKSLLTTEARQQALFFLFQDCCNNTGTTCDRCSYLKAD